MSETPDSMAALERDFCGHLVRWGIAVMSKWTGTDARLRNTIAICTGWDPARAQEFIDRVNTQGSPHQPEALDRRAPWVGYQPHPAEKTLREFR